MCQWHSNDFQRQTNNTRCFPLVAYPNISRLSKILTWYLTPQKVTAIRTTHHPTIPSRPWICRSGEFIGLLPVRHWVVVVGSLLTWAILNHLNCLVCWICCWRMYVIELFYMFSWIHGPSTKIKILNSEIIDQKMNNPFSNSPTLMHLANFGTSNSMMIHIQTRDTWFVVEKSKAILWRLFQRLAKKMLPYSIPCFVASFSLAPQRSSDAVHAILATRASG